MILQPIKRDKQGSGRSAAATKPTNPTTLPPASLRFDDDAPLMRQVARAFRNAWVQHQPEGQQRYAVVDKSAPLLTWSKTYLPHYFTKPPSAMHEWLAGKVHSARSNRGRSISCVGPRGGAKSTVGNLANIIRCAVEGTENYIWIISETQTLAAKQLHSIKQEIERNEQLIRDYPEATGIGPEWSMNRIRLKNGTVVIEAIGKGQAIRGSRNRADRPTLIVCDDLQDDKVILSPDQRTKDWEWFTNSVLNAGDPNTNFVNLANALHREAIGMRLLTTPGWESAVFSAIVEWPTNMALWEQWGEIFCNVDNPNAVEAAREFYEANLDAMNEGAKLLWESREDLYYLMVLRAKNGRSAFEREKQSRPINPENCEWPETYFCDNDQSSVWFDAWPDRWQIKTMALDPSKGRDSRRGDYSAYVKLLFGVDGILYVDANLARRDTAVMVSDGCDLVQEFQPDAFGVESNAYQDLLGGEFGREFAARGMINAMPNQIENTVSKVMRIRRLSPYLAQRQIKFKRNSPGVLLLLSQMKDFPNGDHDDGPDALEMTIRLAAEMLYGGKGAAPIGVTQVVAG